MMRQRHPNHHSDNHQNHKRQQRSSASLRPAHLDALHVRVVDRAVFFGAVVARRVVLRGDEGRDDADDPEGEEDWKKRWGLVSGSVGLVGLLR